MPQGQCPQKWREGTDPQLEQRLALLRLGRFLIHQDWEGI